MAQQRRGPGNPNMQKGAPSVNPTGIAKRTTAPGYDGQVAWGGQLDVGEADPDLRGSRGWTTRANMYRRPPVAIWGRLRSALLSGIDWSAVENPSGGAEAKRGKEVVEQGLLLAKFGTGASSKPFSAIAAKSINGAAAVGHSIHATAIGRRKDGMIVFTDIAHRPQHSIAAWLRLRADDDTTPFVAVEQRTSRGGTVRLDLDECLYVVNDNGTNSDSPAGVGMLDLIAERVRRLGVFEPLEGTELVSSMGGIPVTRAPLEEMKTTLRKKLDEKASDFASKLSAAIQEKLRPLQQFVANRFKDPSKLSWFELDSATYTGEGGAPSGVRKWDIEIIKGDMQGLPEMRVVNRDYDLDIARMLGVEHVFIGGGDTAGTYGAHESKITAMGATLNAETLFFSFIAEQQLARTICIRNGLDPDLACPSIVPSPIMRTDIIAAVDAVTKIQQAGLRKNHPAKRAVFEGVNLPWEDEDETEDMAPRAPFPYLPGARESAEPENVADPVEEETPTNAPAEEMP